MASWADDTGYPEFDFEPCPRSRYDLLCDKADMDRKRRKEDLLWAMEPPQDRLSVSGPIGSEPHREDPLD